MKSAYLRSTIAGLIFVLSFRHRLLYAQFLQLFSEESALSPRFQPLKTRYELQVTFAKIFSNDFFELLLIRQTLCDWFSIKYSGRGMLHFRVTLDNPSVKSVFFLYSFIFKVLLRPKKASLVFFFFFFFFGGGGDFKTMLTKHLLTQVLSSDRSHNQLWLLVLILNS